MKPSISTHVCNDDPRLYRFERTSGLPLNYFQPRRFTPDAWVLLALAACVALLLIVTRTI